MEKRWRFRAIFETEKNMNDLKISIKKELKVFYGFVYRRFFFNPKIEKKFIDEFHKFYFYSRVIGNTKWMGINVLKIPLDLWIYQEIIYETKPDVIIECGTGWGGTTLFLANICDYLKHGKIISIDIVPYERPKHQRIKYLLGPSTSDNIIRNVEKLINKGSRVMVILDSDHRKEYVLKEIKVFSKFVTKGNYLIVEDTNVNGHPVSDDHGPGPYEAVSEFLKRNRKFQIDKSREKFYISQNPNGYLLKMN